MTIDLPCRLSGEHLLIVSPRPVAWIPRCVIFSLDIFIMGGILWLYRTQGLFKICTPDTDVTSLLLFYSFESFSHQSGLIFFYWSLGDSKSLQVSRPLLSILADLSNAVVWMVSTRPLIFKSSSPCTNPLITVLSESFRIGITVTFMFHSFSGL